MLSVSRRGTDKASVSDLQTRDQLVNQGTHRPVTTTVEAITSSSPAALPTTENALPNGAEQNVSKVRKRSERKSEAPSTVDLAVGDNTLGTAIGLPSSPLAKVTERPLDNLLAATEAEPDMSTGPSGRKRRRTQEQKALEESGFYTGRGTTTSPRDKKRSKTNDGRKVRFAEEPDAIESTEESTFDPMGEGEISEDRIVVKHVSRPPASASAPPAKSKQSAAGVEVEEKKIKKKRATTTGIGARARKTAPVREIPVSTTRLENTNHSAVVATTEPIPLKNDRSTSKSRPTAAGSSNVTSVIDIRGDASESEDELSLTSQANDLRGQFGIKPEPAGGVAAAGSESVSERMDALAKKARSIAARQNAATGAETRARGKKAM